MRSDDAHFLDMLLSARKVAKFTSGLDEQSFLASELHQSAVIRELQVIGEAARQVSEQTKAEHSEIEWDKIAGMRNRLIHEYFRIRLNLVWQVVQEDLDKLIEQLEPIIPQDADTLNQ